MRTKSWLSLNYGRNKSAEQTITKSSFGVQLFGLTFCVAQCLLPVPNWADAMVELFLWADKADLIVSGVCG